MINNKIDVKHYAAPNDIHAEIIIDRIEGFPLFELNMSWKYKMFDGVNTTTIGRSINTSQSTSQQTNAEDRTLYLHHSIIV